MTARKITTRGVLDRAYVVSHEGNAALWECPKGHQWRAPLLPRNRIRGVGPVGFALMASWWSKGKGGVSGMPCPSCAKAREK